MLTHHPSIKPWRDQPFMKYTDTQLKQALAKMLPETLQIHNDSQAWLRWKETGYQVEDTELLHLCWLVEETLGSTLGTRYQYGFILDSMTSVITRFEVVHATWQQRVTALCKVKGIEI